MVSGRGIYVGIFKNDFLELSESNGKVFIETLQTGFLLNDFDAIIRLNPRIKLTNFAVLKNALTNVSTTPIEIGNWLPPISLEVSRDKMSASLFVYVTPEYVRENKQQFQQDVKRLLKEHKIQHGIIDLKIESIISSKAILIAQGSPPTKGEDAVAKYLQVPERKPVIRDDGKADYYDMNFIYEIEEGAWLGEKTHAQQGIPGYNVYNEALPAQTGRDVALKFDRKSAYEIEEENKTVIRSKISGVLEDTKGIVGVSRHLPINGDVGIETGNIEFNGSVSIRGTVHAGFTVIAHGDISIEGSEGVTGVKLIKSIDGDIFIRGGIFGLGQTRIEAGGSIFVKHVNEANLLAGQDVNIGFYALGSNIKAHSILVDERKGKIIGGTATAKSMITMAVSGNRLERRTELIINSVNKQDGLDIIKSKVALLKSMQEDVLQQEAQVNRVLPVISNLTRPQIAAFEQTKQKLVKSKEMVMELDREIKQLMQDLRSVGREEILISKDAFPGTYIQIGKKSSVLSNMTNGKFLLESGELNV